MTKQLKAKHALFAGTLHKNGYSATDARLVILEYFRTHRRPVSVRHIVENIAAVPGAGRIDQSTVYRTINSLKSKNIIRQVDLRHNHAHYELTALAEHHHLICTHCGKIEDVQHCDIENMRSIVLRQSKHFAEIQQHSLEFYGVCNVCAAKQLKKS